MTRRSRSHSGWRGCSRSQSRRFSMMGATMTERGEGEILEARRRRLFWWTIGGLFGAGMVMGVFIGVNAARKGLPFGEIWSSVPQTIVVALVAVGLAAFIYGCWR